MEGGIAHSNIITEFSDDFYPTDMQWHPRPNYAVLITKKQSLDILLITTADGICSFIFSVLRIFRNFIIILFYIFFYFNIFFLGKYHLVNKNGRIEKSVDAHKGATTVGRWSNDGSALLTGKTLYKDI